MSAKCIWLHESIVVLPQISYPFEVELPPNGIYFYYEDSQVLGHGSYKPRIVRIGINKGANNFRKRISEHYLPSEKKMNFNKNRPKPSDRSIFRKNIGRALLNKANDPYLKIWDKDFTTRNKREQYGDFRDISKEKQIEREITKALRETFSFKLMIVEDNEERKKLESRLIPTVNKCSQCIPSLDWLGKHSPKKKIRDSGLWQEQHLNGQEIDNEDKVIIMRAILKTLYWFEQLDIAVED